MLRKKNSALGVKFVSNSKRRLDEITDMEGACHTFVTPVLGKCEIVGDYRYDASRGGHGVVKFGNEEGMRVTRSVVMSASIQMDFENSRVMVRLCKLDDAPVEGKHLGDEWEILNVKEKQDKKLRDEYDDSLRRHLVFHLTKDGRLPKRSEVNTTDMDSAISYLEEVILARLCYEDVSKKLDGKYVEVQDGKILALELLFNTAVEQVRNEISALEALCPQGYIYTYDPASIFAREIGSTILNRLMLLGLMVLSNENHFKNMVIFAFNDYADRGILPLVEKALENQKGVKIMSKVDLFGGEGGVYDVKVMKGLDRVEECMLVVHNNSDAFGQNIETEGVFGSLDGAVGASSSAAASLERERSDLLDFLC